MKQKITLPQLSAAVASLTTGQASTAETFIRQLFDLIAESLAKGESVTVKGIGTFRLSDNPDSPVEWIADKELAEAVNEPFAFFEPVELGEGVDETMFEAAGAETAGDSETAAEEAAEVIGDTVEEEKASAVPPAIPPIPRIPPIPTAGTGTKAETEQVQVTEPEREPEQEQEQEQETEPEQKPEQKHEPDTTAEETADTDIVECVTDNTSEDFYDEPTRQLNPWLMLVAGVIIGLIAGYFLGTATRPISGGDGTEATVTVTDTLTAPVPTAAAGDSITHATDAPADTVVRFEPIAVDTVGSSRYLTTMARKYYGDYKFWVYIYEENSDIITNPNRIRPGTEVKIPAPEKYGIDASDPESIRRAEKKIGEISARLAK